MGEFPNTYHERPWLFALFKAITTGAKPEGTWKVLSTIDVSHRLRCPEGLNEKQYAASRQILLECGVQRAFLNVGYAETADRKNLCDPMIRRLVWTPPPQLEGMLVRLEMTANHAGISQSVRVAPLPSQMIERLVEEEIA